MLIGFNASRGSWWLKYGRGQEHANTLKVTVQSWVDAHQGRAAWQPAKRFDTNLDCFIYYVESIELPPIEWSLQIGDLLHNFRSALDHLAWYLVNAGTAAPPLKPRQVSFPIYDTAAAFKSAVGNSVPGISAAQQAIIERHQPYHKSRDPQFHPLALLRDLNNIDKHREIRVIVAQDFGTFSAQVIDQKGFVVERTEPASDLFAILRRYPGAEIARVYGRVTGDEEPSVTMLFQGTTGLALEMGLPTIETLETIETEVADVFNAFEAIL